MNRQKHKLSRRILAVLLMAVMLITMFPSAMFAAPTEPTPANNGSGQGTTSVTKTENGVTVNKYVTGDKDSGYNLTLEAYASENLETTTNAEPLDIVLVLDMSGSMDEEFTDSTTSYNPVYELKQNETYYIKSGYWYQRVTYSNYHRSWGYEYREWYQTKWQSVEPKTSENDSNEDHHQFYTRTETAAQDKIDALKSAVGTFIDNVSQNAEENNIDHRVSIVKFAGKSSDNIGDDWYDEEYGLRKNWYNHSQTVVDLTNVRNGGAADLKNTVNELEPAGATRADYGMKHAASVLDNSDNDKVVVMFTDGTPTSSNEFSSTVADDAIQTAKTLKADGTSIYTVGIFQGANPQDDPTDKRTSNENKYMHAVSSNYPKAEAYDQLGDRAENSNYYFAAEDAAGLTGAFEDIWEDVLIGQLEAEPDAGAVLSDTLGKYFKFPQGFDGTENVSAKYVPAEVDEAGNITFNEDKSEDRAVRITVDGKDISITGFNYKGNVVSYNKDNNTVTGGKLVVTFPIEVDANACLTDPDFKNGWHDTNAAASLAYKSTADSEGNDGATILPDSPQVEINKADLSMNGTDVTVQIFADGKEVKGQDLTNLLNADLRISRATGENDNYHAFNLVSTDENGILTYDFDYNPDNGHDCVDLNVSFDSSKYVLQGVEYNQSSGSGSPEQVNGDNGDYTIDNVVAGEKITDGQAYPVDCTIYLYNKYNVQYYLDGQLLDQDDYDGKYVDGTSYISKESVAKTTATAPQDREDLAQKVAWKNENCATAISLPELPTKDGYTVSGWNLGSVEGTNYTENTSAKVADVLSGASGSVVPFYATSTLNPKDLTAFNKEVVTAKVDGISGDYQYPKRTENGYSLTVDEGTEVTLLYKITVEGNVGAEFDVTDVDAELVKVITEGVEIDSTTMEGHFTGTIPSGGKVEFYVATDFGVVNDDKDLKNVASVSNTNGGKDPDDPDEEVTVPVDVTPVYKITSIDKFYISSEKDLTEDTASEIDMSKYAVPDTESEKVIVPNDGTSVTLLYGITVKGTSGATFEVTDTGAELVTYQVDEVIDGKAAISGANGVFTGTIPDDGELTFYVSKQFDKDDIKDGNLNNTAAITKGDVEPGKDEDPVDVPAEEEKATIDSIDKFYVNPEESGFNKDETSPAIDLTKYAGLDEYGNIVIPENGTVTVLYGITVKGTPGASFNVMDDSALFVAAKTTDTLSNGKSAISGSQDAFTGTFPADGEVTFYVSKTFDANDINNGQITNIAEAKLAGEKDMIKDTETNNAIVEEAVEIPDDEDLIALIGGQITVDCINGDVEHPDKVYPVDEKHYTVSDLTTNADGQPTFTVAIKTDAYIADYSNDIGKEHTLYSVEGQPVEGQYEFTFTWDGIKWVVNPEDALTIRVECEYGITGIDKFLVADADQKEATGLTEEQLARFTFPDEKGRINLPKDGKVTLLYGITVTGDAGEEFTVTDENALLTPDITTTVENKDNGIFTGTIPESGRITFYVEKVFAVDDIDKDIVEGQESLVNKAEITEGDVVPDEKDDEEIVPVATGYSLTYEANGGYFANDPAKTTATVGELNPAEYPLWTKDTAVSTIPVDENGNELAKPTHAQAAPPEDTVISDADLVDVELIGWTTEVPESAGQIYAAGDKYPTLTDKATIEDDNVIVYAVWGYDENNDGVADATQIVITPADITIYSGGTGYEGVLGENGELVGTEGAQNGLPEPGYYFILPYQLNEKLGGAANIIDLSGQLHLDYINQNDENDVRGWNLELYNKDNPKQSMAYGKYVYRLIPETTGYPVRLEIKDGDNLVSSDNFTISLSSLSKTYSMKLYTAPEVDRVQVTAQIRNDKNDWVDANEALGDNVVQGIARGTATLTIRGTTEDQPVSAIQNTVAEEVDAITAVEPENVDYYINGSKIPVVMNESASNVQLLNDTIVNESGSQDVMENAIVSEAANDPDVNIDADYAFDFRYLDLVDTDNGNAYVTMGEGQEMTIYWPYPEGMDQDDTFYIAHFDGLDREFTAEELNTAVANSDLKLYHEGDATYELETTEFGIKFTTSSFSPFALVYDASQADDGDDNPPYYPWHPDGDDDGPSGLNTEDHFSYVVGYAEDYRTGEATDNEDLWPVKPNNQITRAEVATIFYRLLEDEVRDEYDTTTNDFSDVTADSWYNQTVSTLARMGIVKGYEDGSFRPNAPITRAEFGAIATRFFAETGATYEPGTFTDVTGNEWFANAIQDAVNLGLIGGYPDGTVRPNNNITRAEACAIVNRTLGRVPDADHLLPEDVMKVWPDNNPTDWFYADMQEATNGHEYAWIEEDGHEIEEWTNLLDKDWTDR